ncbi:hypothetical protein P152DRAFT_33757 [Eremomyces bilateralis CBS 781.70]|uniref:rRNA-processing protein n=1 Tax=Eremomyces bilateralis CBS 781.70 TaxID=1392243 RepID=A0A6G1G384_9PEZI|nr:uncharacterized protein P152DRAFT_33757 [Eremomyces bilateralis CBS 781.70]KAF1812380.1 hypothetical protein P152DRAFT_33757 [Eremomyces bilateralis CBS 781.70]
MADTQATQTTITEQSDSNPMTLGKRVNGKNWHEPKTAFRPTAGLTSFAKRMAKQKALDSVKAKEREMKEEKAASRQKWIQGIKDRREAKAEKERYAKMAETMHQKRVERLRRREKRNKMLKS